MRAAEYFPLAIKMNENYEILLILQGGIVISAECIFEDKMASAPGPLICFTYKTIAVTIE